VKIVLLLTHDVQFPFFLHDGKNLVEAGGLLSLWQMDFLACEIILLNEIGDCCGAHAWCVVSFSCKMENSWLRQVEFRACANFLGKFLLEAFGIQSLFRCSLAHMLCTVCFTS